MILRHRTLLVVALVATLMARASPARAGSPLAAIPIGRSTTYHVTSQSVTQSGPHSASHYVKFTHSAPNAFAVSVDGAPSETISLGGGGSLAVPPQLKSALGPFAEMAILMRGAPRPISQNASWAANLPVPIESTTDNVTVAMVVTQASNNQATIVGNGSNSTMVRPVFREHPVAVSVKVTIALGAAYTIASAGSQVSIVVHMGALGARDKHFGSSWTIAPVP